MKTLWLDLETFHGSENLKVCGTYRYALDAEVMLAAWAWNDDLPTVWDFTDCTRDVKDLQALIDEADEVVVHNSSFERIILREQGVTLPFEKIDDTAVIALQHGLVKDLDRLCSILGVPESESKLKEGKKLITLFCSPCPKNWKLRRATRESHPEEWARFKVYAAMDIVSMREVRRRLPRWNCTPLERRYFELDQRINDRGFKVDTALATSATAAFRRLVDALAIRTKELTGGVIGSVTEVAKLVEYLQAQGLTLFDMTKDTVEGLLLRDDIRSDLRELLEIRQQASRTTPSKFKALMKAMSPADERLRGTLQFCGAARTGRDCLAEGTLVAVRTATRHVGERPIEQVRLTDEVWDGDNWVSHEGVVFSGDKDVIEHDGVVATAEHVVYTSTTESVSLGNAKEQGVPLWPGNSFSYTD